jgi:hypothetical protein
MLIFSAILEPEDSNRLRCLFIVQATQKLTSSDMSVRVKALSPWRVGGAGAVIQHHDRDAAKDPDRTAA